MNTHPISFLASDASEVIKQAEETQSPVMITVNGQVAAVVQDIDTYQKTQERLALLTLLAYGQKEIEQGKIVDHEDFFAELEEEYRESSK